LKSKGNNRNWIELQGIWIVTPLKSTSPRLLGTTKFYACCRKHSKTVISHSKLPVFHPSNLHVYNVLTYYSLFVRTSHFRSCDATLQCCLFQILSLLSHVCMNALYLLGSIKMQFCRECHMREKKIFSSVNLEEANVLTSVCESKHCFAHIKEKNWCT